MRSLWRTIAARWLGGQGSDALTGDSMLLDLIMPSEPRAPEFRVERHSAVSHRAMLSQHDQQTTGRDRALADTRSRDGSA
ncbi:MAG: hypothetical protein ACREE2_17640 [Stellaceae bacterium]